MPSRHMHGVLHEYKEKLESNPSAISDDELRLLDVAITDKMSGTGNKNELLIQVADLIDKEEENRSR